MAVDWNSAATEERVRKAVMRGVIIGTEMVRNEAVRLVLQGSKTGKTYRRRGVTHVASAPGEPFASDTGRTVNAFATRYDFSNLTGTVVNTAANFPFLEYGTRNMEPRPSLRPALANTKGAVEGAIAAEITREFGL